MAVLVTGTRFDQEAEFERSLAVAELLLTHIAAAETVLVGDARGVDAVARKVLEPRNDLRVYEAEWRKHDGCFCFNKQPGSFCKYAGFRRNDEMLAQRPERVIAIWDGKSPGTRHTIKGAERLGIPVERYRLPSLLLSLLDMDVPPPREG